ncbi:MAG: hypothetical protein QOH89_2572, partial [Pseudonocardiales bacterium]|nr:hypothetical protein [Pseudonocardiales bacterium]
MSVPVSGGFTGTSIEPSTLSAGRGIHRSESIDLLELVTLRVWRALAFAVLITIAK